MHHIVFDGWSTGVFVEELAALYGTYLRGEQDPLPELKLQYADYAVWQRKWLEGEILREQGEYWRRALAGAPALLELPADHDRPAEQNFSGGFASVKLDELLTGKLKELSKRHGATLFVTLLAGWAALLARLSGTARHCDWKSNCQSRTERDREAHRVIRQHCCLEDRCCKRSERRRDFGPREGAGA